MTCRQRHELLTSAKQKRIPANEKRVGPLPPKCCEGGIDLAAGAGVYDIDLHPK